MNTKLISALCVILGVSAANAAETKVSGEFFGNLTWEVDNDGPNEGKGFNTERARVGVTHSFNDTWSVTLGVDAAGLVTDSAGDTSTGTVFNRAFVTGKNWLADGHTMHFGRQQNAYVRAWEAKNARWIHSDLTTEVGLGKTGDNLADYSGVNYNIAFNDMWNIELALNNGPTSEFVSKSEAMGYGLTVVGKFNDNFGLILGYDAYADFDANNAGDSDTAGYAATRATLWYSNAMVDVGLEYAMWDITASDVPADGITADSDANAFALDVTFKYAEGRGVFAKYVMPGDDDSETALGFESQWTLGHTWAIDQNINTGLFYTATSTPAADTSAIQWKWAASF